MGVFGLLRYCLTNKDTASERCNLANQTIVCDFNSFMFEFMQTAEKTTQCPLVNLFGGEYATFDAALNSFFDNLDKFSIKIIFLLDPGTGTEKDLKRKLDTLRDRSRERYQDILKTQQFCSDSAIESLPPRLWFLPQMGKPQLIATMRRPGALIRVSLGEADVEAANMVRSGECYAVLARDSDYCLFPGCRFVPTDNFKVVANGESSEVQLFTAARVAASLRINEAQLPLFAALCGNDITLHIIDKHLIITKLRIRTTRQDSQRCAVEDVAEFIRMSHPPLSEMLTPVAWRELKPAIDECRKYYTDQAAVSWEIPKGAFSDSIMQQMHAEFRMQHRFLVSKDLAH
eukprot:TRINITY_DN578_c0_g1_i1.p1 TRINITY_DN578_c0_g1~~TRINITY_DN578_c0_g1_i1.p1  ORF type:complete len:345 (-),score=69.32 TRINITY_DN578_c0_g1_i1:793-1827(-)